MREEPIHRTADVSDGYGTADARGDQCERGAASVLAVGICASLVLATAAAVPLAMSLAAAQSADGAADSAALAAADVASGLEPGIPCAAAELVAAANGADLIDCVVDGMVVTVHVTRLVGALRISARATAGPDAPGDR